MASLGVKTTLSVCPKPGASTVPVPGVYANVPATAEFMKESLEPTEQRVMTLHYVDEMPLDAITRLLGLTNSSGAKAHVVSARRKLNAAVARWKEGTPNANP